MRERAPGIQTIQFSEVTEPLLRLMSKVSRRETRILVENAGEPVAALVSAEDLRRLDEFDQRTGAIERFSKAFTDVSAEDVEADVARIIEEQRTLRSGGASG